MEEHVRLETQLRQSQKMETIGTLAGGIAHDFNNVLNIVKGYTNSIATHPALDGEIAEQIKVIEEATERGTSVVRQLLTLARKTQSHLVSTNVNEVISGLRNLLKQTLPKTIDIALELDAKLPVAMADPHQLTQALLNLCVNARDAMPDGGKLTIKTFVTTGTEGKNAGTQGKPYLCIEVIDTGIGMTDSVRARIFEPFYTTKDIGDGTGLGLSIVYGIVKDHNGSIDAFSTSGEGSTFRMCLPVASSQQIGMDEGLRSRAIQKQPRHQRTVLLVEDEEMMVLLMKKVLGKNGYTVLVALDGQKALDLFDLHKDEIDVVLLDMGLPKKSGWNVILKMKEDKPDARIVVSSGYIDLDLKTRMNQAGVTDFIDKPYAPLDVVELLDAVIERNLP
jgi:CheY-like chemotaxis protein